jgi:hypothetical protein
VTTLASFYALAGAAPIQKDQRRFCLGAAYQIQERVGWGESITSARGRVMAFRSTRTRSSPPGSMTTLR